MVRRMVFGSPYQTGAVVEQTEQTGECPAGITIEAGASFCLRSRLQEGERVYGLGETVRGINKRGWVYVSKNCDEKDQFEDRHSVYCAHNFLLLEREKPLGLFFDYPAEITFDIGYTRSDELVVTAERADLTLYLYQGENLQEVVRAFRRSIGRSYLAPRWAFGYQQCRWGYGDEEAVREVARGYREAGIPLDAIGLDIDYMERYKDFSIDQERFGDFAGLARELREQGIHLVPIIDAAVKVEDGYDIYEEGRDNGYFCKKEDGEDFVVGVWPGRSCLPDFMKPEAGAWFGRHYRLFTEMGIDGFWNDMNEPALFYSEEGIAAAWEKVDRLREANLDVNTFFELEGAFPACADSEEDYKRFYHCTPQGRLRHDVLHNIYGYAMTRATGEELAKLLPNRRYLLFSRSSYVGMHRYGGTWMGDNKAWWSHILYNLKLLPSLNMCGFLYTGADLGGFAGNTTRDLMLRWLALGVFTPLMRNHARRGMRDKECYKFERTEDFKNVISVRYALLPYLYSEYLKAVLEDRMLFRPLHFDYPQDEAAADLEDQLMLGEGLMIAPVYQQNARGRLVYLPEDMLFVRFKSGSRYELEPMEKGTHYMTAELAEVPLFIRKNHLLPLVPAAQSTADLREDVFTLVGWGERELSYTLWSDDGEQCEGAGSRRICLRALKEQAELMAEGASPQLRGRLLWDQELG